jgi:hypothetical protein
MTSTQSIAGHEITLTIGRRYLASRPMMEMPNQRFFVTITDITDDADYGCTEAMIRDLDYTDANQFLAEFNNDSTSFSGRIWE